MDDPPRGAGASCRFGPDRRLAAVWAALAVIAAALAAFDSDGPGRVLAVIAALLLAAYAVTDVAFWPRLIADRSGLTIRTPTTRATLHWSEVDDVHVDERSRLGLMSRTLEIDSGDLLVVLSRRTLGADPETVVELLNAFRHGRSP